MTFLRAVPLIVVLALISGCSSAPDPSAENIVPNTSAAPDTKISDAKDVADGSCGLDIPADATVEEIIQAVLDAEGQLVVAQNIGQLMKLWGEESQITDAKNTPDASEDDHEWNGADAIRHRYVRIVFPGAPASVQPADLQFSIDDNEAVVNATTHIGTEVSPAGDRWQLFNDDGCWMIRTLTYNLEPK